MSRAPARAGGLLALLVASALGGCGGSAHSHPGAGARPASRLGCAPAGGATPSLSGTVLGTVALPSPGGDIAVAPRGWWFVSTRTGLEVLHTAAGRARIVRHVPLRSTAGGDAHGLALTPDDRYLLVAEDSGALVLDVQRAKGVAAGRAVLGRLISPVRGDPSAAGATAVRVSGDGRFAFVARTRASGVAVFDLGAALGSGLRRSGYVGRVPVGLGPVGLALAPGGRRLYATALARQPAAGAPSAGAPVGGVLSVIDTARAETDPGRAVLATAPAGCVPLGVSVSPDGGLVWVAALGDHALVAFSARRLERRPAAARLVRVSLSGTPGAVLSLPGARVLASDRSAAGGVVVVGTAQAARGRAVSLGIVRIGGGVQALAVLRRLGAVLAAEAGAPRLQLVRVPGVS